ncbi:glycoside hydrolase family 6 protein [Kutzneria viridogrisea]|uniref:Glucanase n=1 Tax=Kutzneria viridogrisea TaxID=47990 RepID=A0ABR6BS88_9PSEU|nr:endoglucanase [Kutzneria viridogrisea]
MPESTRPAETVQDVVLTVGAVRIPLGQLTATATTWRPVLAAALRTIADLIAQATTPPNPFTSCPGGLYQFSETEPLKWLAANPKHPQAKIIQEKIGAHPMVQWVGPGDADGIRGWVTDHCQRAERAGQMPVWMAYAIIDRDLADIDPTQFSGGGTNSLAEYVAWAENFARGVGQHRAVVLVETDSILHMQALNKEQQRERLSALRSFIDAFARFAPNAVLYLDGGDSRWASPEQVGPWIVQLMDGATNIRGFAANVSNFNTTRDVAEFAATLQRYLADHGHPDTGFVIDTSRNGKGPDQWGSWCNPHGRQIGEAPTTTGAQRHGADALLWVKAPGSSDGECGAAPTARSGLFTPELAMKLITGAE